MPPKNPSLERLFTCTHWRRSAFLGCCALALALLCMMDELQATQRSNSALPDPIMTSLKERSGVLAEEQRIFEATVRLRLDALFTPNPTELGQRECAAAIPKEPVRGRIDRALVLAANEQLNLPMGAGSVLTVAGQSYLFCLEPHYHPPGGGLTPEGWHKGVTVYHAQAPRERRL